MINGLGTDIIEIERIQSVNKDNRLARRILSDEELAKYDSIKNTERKLEYLAGRFAGKEAYAKAVGTGIGTLNFKHIEILNDDDGKPYIVNTNSLISISHSKQYATATVIIMSDN
ncbi:holo-ACP synthase [Nosocomiicoccus massiliensis]|uniref:holo-ACP synthase n=1 Tax=Nosocomiicoccus massiliensis TaxID=1232430 RepID=UPI000429104B|nr:holo-ACP synthase [Nosocomiicoccus massiliensis]